MDDGRQVEVDRAVEDLMDGLALAVRLGAWDEVAALADRLGLVALAARPRGGGGAHR